MFLVDDFKRVVRKGFVYFHLLRLQVVKAGPWMSFGEAMPHCDGFV